jgi:hypothetical protein
MLPNDNINMQSSSNGQDAMNNYNIMIPSASLANGGGMTTPHSMGY